MTVDERIAKLEAEVSRLKDKGKDGWDRFSIFMSALVPLAIAGVGGSYSYFSQKAETEIAEIRSQAESRIKQAELVSKYFEPLTGTNEKKRQFAVDSLLVAAPDYGPVLVRVVAETAPAAAAAYATSALSGRRDVLIRQMFGDDPSQRKNAYEQLLSAWGDDDSLVTAVITHGLSDRTNGNGIYNALVLLSHMQRETIRKKKAEILEFSRAIEDSGPKIKQRADVLRSRLEP